MAATAQHQHTLSTRAGCECIAHVLQASTELDPETTITSIDGISAYDTCPEGLCSKVCRGLPEEVPLLPFVRLFYSFPSAYFWEEHTIHQGEGGTTGRCLHAPSLLCESARSAGSDSPRTEPEREVACFLGRRVFCVENHRELALHNSAQQELWTQCRIRVHVGKTHVWNRAGHKPEAM